ncbi:DgyrCDS1445 [Dimorphilus gyrociliatus]|uniref:DgyrCDS1445 n=1 Tax=Dimorphilus gyrociliatus TaxID=2664684 RepID=A0A7I8VCE7_9ANNE|nr:DgyrCDS1445 [Dimorphilus gyrociliatus]
MVGKDLLTGNVTFKATNPCDLSCCTKEQIKSYFENAYDLNESLFLGLKDSKVFYMCPDRLRLPLIFYYGHTACVYINKLVLADLVQVEERVNFEFEKLFETGVDEHSWDDTHRPNIVYSVASQLYTTTIKLRGNYLQEHFRMGNSFRWPELKDVVEYRKNVRDLVLKVIERTPLQLPITKESPWWGVVLGIEHERIHIETSSVLIRQLPIDLVSRPNGWVYAPLKSESPPGENHMIKISEVSTRELGKSTDFPSFGWDNEYGKIKLEVDPFAASQYLISNREFLQFVQDGGYDKRDFWSDEGWQWKEFRKVRHPTFWVCNKGCNSGCGNPIQTVSRCNLSSGDDYKFRCIFDVVDMPLDWPVEVNFLEAQAFCRWKGPLYRLPTEAEFSIISEDIPINNSVDCDKIHVLKPGEANVAFEYGSSCAVNKYSSNSKGFYDTLGNVWEWLVDHMNGFPGFETHHLYEDFSTPTFDGRHNLILGGSWASTGNEASRFSRYAFRRHFFQHSGFRLAYSITDKAEDIPLPALFISDELFLIGYGVQKNQGEFTENYKGKYQQSFSTFIRYNSQKIINQQLLNEYILKVNDRFVRELQTVLHLSDSERNERRLLHFGCSAGYVTFNIAKFFNSVVAIDRRSRFIDACQKLNEGQILKVPTDKENNEYDIQVQNKENNIIFIQMSWLPNELENFDVILLSLLNDLDERPFLVRMREMVKEDGSLIIHSTKESSTFNNHLNKDFKLRSEKTLPNMTNLFVYDKRERH